MTLKEFNGILNQELGKFYQAKDMHIQEQQDNPLGFKYRLNVPFIRYKEYHVGDYLYFIGTNNSTKYHIGRIGDKSFRNYFTLEEMSSYLEEEVEIAIAKMSIKIHKKNVSGIEKSDIETKTWWQNELDWHKSEIDKLQDIVDELQNSKEFNIER